MKPDETTGSKEQQMQARQNKKQAGSAEKAEFDKKLDGPNRPST